MTDYVVFKFIIFSSTYLPIVIKLFRFSISEDAHMVWVWACTSIAVVPPVCMHTHIRNLKMALKRPTSIHLWTVVSPLLALLPVHKPPSYELSLLQRSLPNCKALLYSAHHVASTSLLISHVLDTAQPCVRSMLHLPEPDSRHTNAHQRIAISR